MKTTLNIKNFRVFDENGVSFEINPITILTGSNSSGKSSVVKAIFLLNSFLAQIRKAIENGDPIQLDKFKLDFTMYPNNLLGRFDKVVHEGSESRTVTIEYTVHSLMLSKDVNVQLVFSTDENDELNNAYLDSITMSTNEGVFYHSSKLANGYCNLNIIKEDYVTFLLTECAIHSFIDLEYDDEFVRSISRDEYDRQRKEVIEYLKSVDKPRRDDIMRFVRFTKRKKSFNEEENVNTEVIEELLGQKSIFFIPALDKLSELPKNKVEAFVSSEYLQKAGEDLISASRKVINAFMQSSFDNFRDFFIDYECRFFNNVVTHTKKSTIHLVKSGELLLPSGYLTIDNPYNYVFENTVSLDEDFNVIKEDKETKKAKREDAIKTWENRPLTFGILYEVVMAWNKTFACDGKGVYAYIDPDPSDFDFWGSVYHSAYKLLTKFAEALVQEVACPDWCGNMSYVSSARASVNRLYTLDTKDDFSMLLRNYFEKKRNYLDYQKNYHYSGKRDYVVDSFMNRWIEQFEIGKAISLHVDKEGLGVQIRLHKTDDDEGRILADEGYGITQLVSILLQIETAILSAQGEKVNKHFRMEMLDHYKTEEFHYEINTIAIEEPEIHLHPKYQSLLADMFQEAYEKYNIHFIIETHSEYLIRKAQVFVARHQYDNEDDMNNQSPFKVYYVPRDDKPYEMEFCPDGRFKNEFGKGFFDEATNLAFEIL